MKTRDIGILIGLGVLVLVTAWYFLIIGPKRDNASNLHSQAVSEEAKLQQGKEKLKNIDQERQAAKQTESDLLKLNKLIPVDSQVPSMIIELQQSASDAGVDFLNIKPGTPVSGQAGTTIVPLELKFEGSFFDVNDFLYRIENYARMEGNDVNVTGRLISVVTLKIGAPDVTGNKLPQLSSTGEVTSGDVGITIDINVYMTSPPPAKTGAAAPSAGSSSSSSSTPNQATTTPGSASTNG